MQIPSPSPYQNSGKAWARCQSTLPDGCGSCILPETSKEVHRRIAKSESEILASPLLNNKQNIFIEEDSALGKDPNRAPRVNLVSL